MAGYRLLSILVFSNLLCLILGDWRARHEENRTTSLECGFTVSSTTQTGCETTHQQVFKLLQVNSNRVLLGSTECLYVLNTDLTSFRSVPLVLEDADRTTCEYAFSEPQKDFICKNYISYTHDISPTSFRVCGTYNSVNPRCWTCTDDGTNVGCSSSFRTDLMLRTPTQNFTILKAADSGQDYYFLGGLETYTSPENILAKVEVNLAADVTSTTVKTDDNQEQLLKPPGDFAGSIERGEYVYFFFRERALEYENIGKIIYSRVARVCKNDVGGVTNPLRGEFTTFLKTRLMCSVGTDFPFIFNELQDVKQSTRNPDIVYGLFTTSSAGSSSTAVCRYNMSEVETLFNQDFRRGQPSPTQLWQRINRDSEDLEARRTCTETFPFSSYYHLEDYPLLNTNAPNCGLEKTCSDYTRLSHDALAVFEGIRGQQLAVLDDSAVPIKVYVGTNNQTIYEASISASDVRITRQIAVHADVESITETQKANKWPLSVTYLQVHDGDIYGTLDNCAFRFTPYFTEELKFIDRSPQSSTFSHPIHIEDATTQIFKLFEGPDGSGAQATFSEKLQKYNCTQKNYKSSGARKREFLHVSCNIKGNLTESFDATIRISSLLSVVADLEVSVHVEMDNSAVATDQQAEVNQYDQEMAKYRYKFQEWLGNVTCPDGNKQTCPSASSPRLM